MTTDPVNERIEAAWRELTGQGARISITGIAAKAGIPRSSLYRNAEARDLVTRRIAETRREADRNLAAEVRRLAMLVDALAARVRNQEERLRQLEGRPHTTSADAP
jgi:AcrR family transcriptional regulator